MMESEDLANRIRKIESVVLRSNAILEETLSISREHLLILRHGTAGYKSRVLSEIKADGLEKILAVIRLDKSLRYPHRKVLDFLVDQFDPVENTFKEINFSAIVKACRLGKNKAKGYLEDLINKGYLNRRSDGYRVWYRMVA